MQGDLNDDQIRSYFGQYGEITDAVVGGCANVWCLRYNLQLWQAAPRTQAV